MVCLVINGDTLEKGCRCDVKDRDLEKKLVERLLEAEPKIASICLNINKENTNAILGRKNICLYGKEYITNNLDIDSLFTQNTSFSFVNKIVFFHGIVNSFGNKEVKENQGEELLNVVSYISNITHT